jgi:uncharacterized protein YkwD
MEAGTNIAGRHRALIALIAVGVIAYGLLVAAPGPDPARAGICTDADAPPAPLPGHVSSTDTETALRCLINNARKSRGLKVLRYNGRLSSAAQNHSTSMDNRNFFSHYSRDGTSFITRIRRTGYMSGTRAWAVGENIGWGHSVLGTARAIFNSWMNSSGHRSQILKSSYRDIGIGVSWGRPTGRLEYGSATYTADFGRRWY